MTKLCCKHGVNTRQDVKQIIAQAYSSAILRKTDLLHGVLALFHSLLEFCLGSITVVNNLRPTKMLQWDHGPSWIMEVMWVVSGVC